MRSEKELLGLPKNFREEEKQLLKKGINSWISIKSLKDEEISTLVQEGCGTTRNLKKIRGIASLMYEMKISQYDAALLIHAGIPSLNALAALTPQELLHKTGRLERQLNTKRKPVVDLKKAFKWIQEAKNRQILN